MIEQRAIAGGAAARNSHAEEMARVAGAGRDPADGSPSTPQQLTRQSRWLGVSGLLGPVVLGRRRQFGHKERSAPCILLLVNCFQRPAKSVRPSPWGRWPRCGGREMVRSGELVRCLGHHLAGQLVRAMEPEQPGGAMATLVEDRNGRNTKSTAPRFLSLRLGSEYPTAAPATI